MLLFYTDLYFNPTCWCLRILSKESERLVMSAREGQWWKGPSLQWHQKRFIQVWDESLRADGFILSWSWPCFGRGRHLVDFCTFGETLGTKAKPDPCSQTPLEQWPLGLYAITGPRDLGLVRPRGFISAVYSTLWFRFVATGWLQFLLFWCKGNWNVNSLSLQGGFKKKTKHQPSPTALFFFFLPNPLGIHPSSYRCYLVASTPNVSAN